MQIKAIINEQYRETEIHVCKNRRDAEVHRIVDELHAMYDPAIAGTDEAGNRCMLRPGEIFSFYAEQQKVFALDSEKKYTVPKTLQELEQELTSYGFFRISKSEIVNLRRIKSLDLSATGTIRMIMKNGYETYVSRRNVAKLKERISLEKKNRGKEETCSI